MGKYVEKPQATQGGAVPSAKSIDPEMSAKFPALWEYVTEDAWEDGTARETATLLIFYEEGCLKACLNDRSGQRSAFWSNRSLAGLLACVEADLQAGAVEWRTKRSGPKGRRPS